MGSNRSLEEINRFLTANRMARVSSLEELQMIAEAASRVPFPRPGGPEAIYMDLARQYTGGPQASPAPQVAPTSSYTGADIAALGFPGMNQINTMDQMYRSLQGTPDYVDRGVTRPQPSNVRHTFTGMYDDDDVAPAPTPQASMQGSISPTTGSQQAAAARLQAAKDTRATQVDEPEPTPAVADAPTTQTGTVNTTEVSGVLSERDSGNFFTNDANRKIEAQWERIYPKLQEIIFGQMNTSRRANAQDEKDAAYNRIFGTSQGGGFIEDLRQSLSSGGEPVKMRNALNDEIENLRRMKLRPPESKHVDYQSGRSKNPSMTNQEWWPAHYQARIAEWKQNIADRERDVEDKRRAVRLYEQTTNKQLGAMMQTAQKLIDDVPEYVNSGFDQEFRNNIMEDGARTIMYSANPYVDERGQSRTRQTVTHTFGGMYDDDEDTVMGETFTPRDDSGAPPPVADQPGAGIPTDAEGDMNRESDPVATDMPDAGTDPVVDPEVNIDGVPTREELYPDAYGDPNNEINPEVDPTRVTTDNRGDISGEVIQVLGPDDPGFLAWLDGLPENHYIHKEDVNTQLAIYQNHREALGEGSGGPGRDPLQLPAGMSAESVLSQMQKKPTWWPDELAWPPLRIGSIGGGGDQAVTPTAQFDSSTFENIRESVRRGDFGLDRAEALRLADPMAIGEPFSQDVNNDGVDELFIRDPSGNIRQIRKEEPIRETIDQQIASALASGDVIRAQQLRRFNTQPTDMERFQAALDFSNRPASSFELANIAAGNYPLSTIGPDGQRGAMPGQPLNQSFDEMFGAYGGDTDALMSRMMNPDDPNAVAPSLVGRTREALSAAHGWELPETPEQFQASFSTLIQSGFNPATAARALGFMPDEVQSFNQAISPGFQRIGEGDQNLRNAFERAFGAPDFTQLVTPGRRPDTGLNQPQWWREGMDDFRGGTVSPEAQRMARGEGGARVNWGITPGSIEGIQPPSTRQGGDPYSSGTQEAFGREGQTPAIDPNVQAGPNFMNIGMPPTFTGGQRIEQSGALPPSQIPSGLTPSRTSVNPMGQFSVDPSQRRTISTFGSGVGDTEYSHLELMLDDPDLSPQMRRDIERRIAQRRAAGGPGYQAPNVMGGQSFMDTLASPAFAENVGGHLFSQDAARVMRGQAVDEPVGNVFTAANMAPISTQAWQNLTPGSREEIQAFGQKMGISPEEFQRALGQQNPGRQTFSDTIKKNPQKRRQYA